MKELNDFLKEPFNKGDKDWFQKECKEIADELFKKYYINCNNRKFYFAEIEFYYYEEGVWDDDWNKVTYARDGYKAGDLFYHLSGIDVCFNSQYKLKPVKFGGILIRAIKDENKNIIAGPLNCKDEILNACKGKEMPKLICDDSQMQDIEVLSTYRALGKNDIDKEKDRLCFYDKNKQLEWNPEKERYNAKKGNIEKKKGTYKTDRFKI